MGHQSTSTDGKWAYNNLQAEIDWSYRATHVVALAGKAIATGFYQHSPDKAYFFGCSTGGRQGMIEAERFPWDFNGIIAGAPPFGETDTLMHILWGERSMQDGKGGPILSDADLRLVHQAVLDKCDADDGVRDGIVSRPKLCQFDPEALACKRGQAAQCLTGRQVDAVRKFYSGPVTSKGVKISAGGFLPGSELGWGSYWKGDDYPSGRGLIANESLRYLAFLPDPGPGWQPTDFNFDEDYKRFGMMESLYGDTNPDLRKFKAAGGKLIVYHGLNDLEPSPLDSIDYYETVQKTMGGPAATRDFFRLFLIPGMNHCTGGDGAFAVDYLGYIERWVEQGSAPNRLIGAHVPGLPGYEGLALKFPLEPSIHTDFTRPIYPYPLWARYKGAGDTKAAENFEAVDSLSKRVR